MRHLGDDAKAVMMPKRPSIDRRNCLRIGLMFGLASLTACGRKPAPKGLRVAAGASVLALGDSLTAGVGAAPETSYPAVLAELSGWQVHNGGVSGDTSAQALARLPGLLDEHKPALVIVSIGGNDLLRRLPEGELQGNIRRSVEAARAAGAQVLLVAIPRPTLASRLTKVLDDHPLYEQLAAELKLPLHSGAPEGWAVVLADPALRADEIHANAAGYRRFAAGLAATAKAAGLL
jgi:lysophospholipase L1-like esterase